MLLFTQAVYIAMESSFIHLTTKLYLKVTRVRNNYTKKRNPKWTRRKILKLLRIIKRKHKNLQEKTFPFKRENISQKFCFISKVEALCHGDQIQETFLSGLKVTFLSY